MQKQMTFEDKFKRTVCTVWEGIATDCGSQDGEGAIDNIESIFFSLEHKRFDKATLERIKKFDPELKKLAITALKKYG